MYLLLCPSNQASDMLYVVRLHQKMKKVAMSKKSYANKFARVSKYIYKKHCHFFDSFSPSLMASFLRAVLYGLVVYINGVKNVRRAKLF